MATDPGEGIRGPEPAVLNANGTASAITWETNTTSGGTVIGENTTLGRTLGGTLVVDGEADGDGEYATIQAAVDNATDGDRIRVRSGTYRETVVLDKTVELVAPNGATLDGSGFGSTGDARYAFRIEGAAAPVIDGFSTVNYELGFLNAALSTGDWTVRDSTLRAGVEATRSSGDWTIRNSTVVGEIYAREPTGDWTVEEVTMRDGGIQAPDGDGNVTVRDVDVIGASGVGINFQSDSWTVEDVTVDGATSGIFVRGTGTVRDVVVRDIDGTGIFVGGDARVVNATVRNATGVGISVGGDNDPVRIVDSEVTGTTLSQSSNQQANGYGIKAFKPVVVRRTVIEGNARGGIRAYERVDARKNWWGSPAGHAPDDCVGNVDCRRPLDAPPDAGGVPQTLAPETLIVDGDADGDDEYATIQAALDRANPGDRVEVRRGVYEKPSGGDRVFLQVDKNVTLVAPNGAVLQGPGRDDGDTAIQISNLGGSSGRGTERPVSAVVEGFTVREFENGVLAFGPGDWVVRNLSMFEVGTGVQATNAPGDWRVEDTRIDGAADWGVGAGESGDWTIANVTIVGDAVRDSRGNLVPGGGINAAGGDWTITNATLLNYRGINVEQTDGSWTISDTTIRNTSVGIRARSATGRWTVSDTRINGTEFSGIVASSTSGDWVVQDTTITNSSRFGIEAFNTTGDWLVRNTRIDRAGDGSIFANDARGSWRVTRSVLVSGREIEARRASPTGDATGNWWGDPSGADPGDCIGNVDCGRPLSSPPSVGPDDPGAPPRGQNLPPVAELTVRPSTPSSIDPVTLSGRPSLDPDGDALTYRWDLGANGTVDATGPTLTRTFAVGQVPVALTVSDGQANATVRRTIEVRPPDERPNVTVVVERNGGTERPPVSLPVGSRATLNASGSTAPANRTVESITWRFPDGTTATGPTALRRFDALGNRSIGVAVTDSAGVTTTANLTVKVTPPPAPVVTNVSQPGDGIIPQAPGERISGFPRTWRAEVIPNATITNVTFAFPDGTRITDTDGSDGWTATLSQAAALRTLPDGQVTVTARDDRGRTAQLVTGINTFDLPLWGKPYRAVDISSIPGDANRVKGGISIEIPPFDFPLIAADVTGRFGVDTRVTHGIGTPQGSLGGGGTIALSVDPATGTGIGAKGSVDIDGNATVGDERLVVRTADVTAVVKPSIAPQIGTIPTPIGEANITAEFIGTFNASVRANLTDDIEIDRGTYGIGLAVRPVALAEIGDVGFFRLATVRVGGEIGATGRITTTRTALSGVIDGRGKIFAETRLLFFTYRSEIGINRTLVRYGGGTGNALAAAVERRSTGWRQVDKRSAASPSGPYGTDAGVGAARSGSASGVTPLTDDRLADQSPAVAASDNRVTAAWASQRPNLTRANGTEITVSEYSNGTWTGPVAVTTDRRYDAFPAVGAVNGQRAVAWARANESLRLSGLARPSDLARHFDLYVGTVGGGRVTNQTQLTDDALPDLAPTVAGTGDAWLVAWLQDTDGNLTTGSDRRGRYAVLGPDLATVRAEGALPGVTAVDAAADGNDLVLAARNATAGTVVRRTFAADGTLDRRRIYTAPNASGVAVGADTVAWSDGRTLRVARGGTVDSVPARAASVGDLRAFRADDSSVLVYRAPRNGSDKAGLFYRVGGDGADGLTSAAAVDTGGLRVNSGTLAVRNDTLVGAFASSPNATVNADVFGVHQRLAPPDLVANATVREVDPAAATVDVTVSNDGAQRAESTAVTLETPDGRTLSASIGPLGPGGTASRTFTVDRPRAGAASVSVAPVTDERATANNAETVPFRANLTITRVDDRLTDNRSQLVVPVTVRNEGPLPIRNVSYELSVGNRTVTGSVPGISVDRTWTVTPSVDASAIGTSASATVRVGGSQPSVGTDRRRVQVRQPDVGVGEPLRYAENGSGYGRAALVPVFSGDTGETAATVTVETPGGTVTYRVPVEPARSGTDSVSKRVAVGLPPATANGTVRLSTEPTAGTDTAPGDDAAVGTVPVGANESVPTPAVETVTARQVSGNETAVGITLRNRGTVTIGALVQVENGQARETLTATIEPGEQARLETTLPGPGPVTVRTVDETRRASPTSGPPPVAGAPPTDPDGDGRYEDVNGDGKADRADALAYYRNRDSAAIRDDPAAFDFDGDGVAGTVADALALYEEID